MKKSFVVLFVVMTMMVLSGSVFAATTVNVSSVSELQSAHNYSNNMDTTWVYTHSSFASALNVTFSTSTKVEDNYDYIYIYDGSGNQIGKYTGTELAGITVEVPGNVVKVRLTSDSSSNHYGFSVANIFASVTINGFTFSNGVITNYTGFGGDVIIPDTINGIKVTSIGDSAFYNCSSLTSIEIPDSVTSIGSSAFSGCSSLTSIEIPNSVTSIGSSAFYKCSSLTSIEIPNSVTSIGSYAFYYCESLTSIEIPDGVTSIGDYAFNGCTGLTSIEIPDSVIRIDRSAFYNTQYYNNLSNWENDVLYIGNHLIKAKTSLSGDYKIKPNTKSISSYAFESCESITSIELPDSVTSIGDYIFYNCKSLTSIELPDGVTSIGDYIFYNCKSLTSIELPDSVTSIGNYVFEYCESLTSIEIPNSVTSIGMGAFEYCTNLEEITLPFVGAHQGGSGAYDDVFGYIFGYSRSSYDGGVLQYYSSSSYNYYYIPSTLRKVTITNETEIPYGAFDNCSNISEININGGITSIGDSAFESCESLTSIEIPDGVTSIGDYAFYYCESLTSIEIPDGVTSIGLGAFRNTNLKEITLPFVGAHQGGSGDYDDVFGYIFGYSSSSYDGGVLQYYSSSSYNYYYIPSTLKKVTITNETEIPYGAFDNCSNISEININGGITSIGDYAFYNCESLTSIEIPDSVTSIGQNAFYNTQYYNNLSNWENDVLYIGNHLIGAKTSLSDDYKIKLNTKSISSSAFYNCESLPSIEIPDGVTSIGDYAFYNCTSLTSIEIPDSVTSIGGHAFDACRSLEEITLPFVGAHQGGSGAYDDVFGYIFGYNNSSSNGGVLQHYSSLSYNNKYYYIPSTLKKVTITNETEIPYGAFYNCSNISEININRGITSIGEYAFKNCKSLTSIEIPDSVTSIGNSAFYDCSSLTDVTIGNGVTSIGNFAFYDCSSLTDVTIGNGVTSIGCYAICGCTSITSIEIPNSVTSIGSSAFSYCSSLTSIEIPDSVTNIGEYAFENCTSLTSIEIPDSVARIGIYAFGGCTSLEEITLPLICSGLPKQLKKITVTNETEIPDKAFYNFDKLSEIVLNDGITSIGDSAFYNCDSLTSIEIPDSVTSIGNSAFYDCSSLTDVTIGNGVTSIGEDVFYNCTSLEEITLPFIGAHQGGSGDYDDVFGYIFGYSSSSSDGGVKQYYSSSSYNYYYIPSTLKKVTITNETEIPYGAFYNCSNVVEININEGVTSIGEEAFYNCENLTSIEIPDSVTSIGNYAFSGCTSLTSIKIPDSVTSIGNSAFRGCSSLTSIEIPNSVTSIGDRAFFYCSSLTDVTIGNGVTSIGGSAFSYCSSLTSIEIPDSVTSIGNYAFSECTSLADVTIGNGVTSIGEYALPRSVETIYGKKGSAAQTYAHDRIIRFIDLNGSDPDKLDFGTIGISSMWTIYENGKMVLSGTVIPNYDYSDDIPWNKYIEFIDEVEILSGITKIGDYEFQDLNLKKIIIPETVSEISSSAALDLYTEEFDVSSKNATYSSVDGVLFNKNKTTLIRYNTQSRVNSYTVPSTVKTIDRHAFYNAENLESVTLQNGVTTINYSAFSHCSNLKKIIIPKSVKTISDYVFNYVHSECTIYGEKGSTAYTYALDEGINFVVLGAYVIFPDDSNMKRVKVEGVDIVKGVTSGTTVSDLKKEIENGGGVDDATIKIVDANGKTVKSGKVCSGYQIVVSQSTSEIERLTIYIDGDTDGDGICSTKDVNDITRYFGGVYLPTYWISVDYNGDLKVDYSEFMMMLKMVAGENEK